MMRDVLEHSRRFECMLARSIDQCVERAGDVRFCGCVGDGEAFQYSERVFDPSHC